MINQQYNFSEITFLNYSMHLFSAHKSKSKISNRSIFNEEKKKQRFLHELIDFRI